MVFFLRKRFEKKKTNRDYTAKIFTKFVFATRICPCMKVQRKHLEKEGETLKLVCYLTASI